MITVTCNICLEKDPTNKVQLKSAVIARSNEEAMANLGREMLAHLQNVHPEAIFNIVMNAKQTNAIMVMRHFDSVDETYNEQRELIRDQVCEAVMLGVIEDDEEADEDYEDEEEVLEELVVHAEPRDGYRSPIDEVKV